MIKNLLRLIKIINKIDYNNKLLVKNYKKKVPINRMAYVKEIVASIEFLLNDECNYINGHNLVVDGGFTAWWKTLKM